MLPGCCKNGIVISKIPVMQAGLKEVMRTHFPEYEIISSASAEDLTLLQLIRGIYAREKTHWVIVFADSGCGWWRRVIAGAKSLT